MAAVASPACRRAAGLQIPYWTLYYEVFLYLVIFVVARASPRLVGPAILLWAVTAWIYQDRPFGNGNYPFPSAYHLLFPVFAAYFAAGILASYRDKLPTPLRWRTVLALVNAAFALISFSASNLLQIPFLRDQLLLPLVKAFNGGDAFVLMYVAGCYFAVRAAVLWTPSGLVGKVMRRLGDQSYGIYLVHMAAMHAVIVIFAPQHWAGGFAETVCFVFVLALPASMAFGWLEYRLQLWLKSPVRKAI